MIAKQKRKEDIPARKEVMKSRRGKQSTEDWSKR